MVELLCGSMRLEQQLFLLNSIRARKDSSRSDPEVSRSEVVAAAFRNCQSRSNVWRIAVRGCRHLDRPDLFFPCAFNKTENGNEKGNDRNCSDQQHGSDLYGIASG